MEPIAIGTARQLSNRHPLSILLRPHFLFMLANNHLGQQRLINDRGPVDELLAGTLAESMKLVQDAVEGWDINEFAFPKEIENRGMNQIPHYPYRDDGMLVWNAIHTFVSDYLNYFYPTSSLIDNDTELQAWALELSDQTNGGKVNGMPPRIDTVNQLIEIVTTVIFTCGPKHSAVNFAQYEYMTFAANMPLAAYQNPIEATELDESGNKKQQEPITEEKILALLPHYKRAADQLQSLFVLSAYRYDRLGYYNKAFQELYSQKIEDVFVGGDNAIIDMVRQFQQNLNMVEQEIDANNQKRVVPYPYLKPSLILNSISI
jgi:arachidonate 15-lipoxygenase